jgi:TonB family protein
VRFRTCPWLLACLLISSRAVGQAEPVTPPRIVHFVEANARSETETAVGLEITIGTDGRVTNASVVESANPELDAAALDAVKQFEFEPARRGDQPVAVTIRYRYVFAKATPEPATESEKPALPEPEPKPKPASPAAEIAASEDEPEYGATAEVEAPPTTALRRSVQAKQLARVPGARGDAIRAIDVLPGVAPDPNDSVPLIRGSSQIDSQVFLDGTPVPLLFHFGGLTSFFQSRLLERVELHPGNFSSRYGRASGGVIDVKTRKLRRDRVHAMIDLSVIDSSAMAEAPLGKNGAVALAARRSNVDFFFETFVPEDSYSVVAAPVYWDYQAMFEYDLGSKHTLKVLGYGSRDSIELVFSKPNADDPTLRGTVGGAATFHRLGLQLDSRLGDGMRHSASLTVGKQSVDLAFGPLYQRLEAYELYGRSNWSLPFSDEVELDLGIDFFGQIANGRYSGPRPNGWDDADPTADDSAALGETITISRDGIAIVAPAAWIELQLRPIDDVLISPGVRVDYYEQLREATIDPRLSARLEVSSNTTLKGGVGVYSQPPQWYEVLEDVGNPNLGPYRAIHFGGGVEQKIGKAVDVGVEGFEKRILDRVVSSAGNRAPYLENRGTGRIYGAEFSLNLHPSPDTFGYVAYTLSRSERRDGDDAWYVFQGDHTHVLSAVLAQKLGRGWEVGARFRYVSGAPTTPVLGATYDARLDLYRPQYGLVNSERDPAFHQLDLRVEKEWHISDLTLAAYVEVLNAYNAKNPQGKRYSYDYSKQESVSGLPILPNIGVRGEL